MTDDTHRAILRRIAAPAGRATDDVLAALRLAAVRAGDEGYGLILSVREADSMAPDLAALEAEMQPDTLPVLLLGGPGRTGLAVFSPELALALLEWRLTGALAEAAPPLRTLTATDAALLADFTDPLLATLGDSNGADWARGFAQGERLCDPRHLALRLAPGGYRGFRLTLALGPEGRGGALFLALPGPDPMQRPAAGAGALPAAPSLREGVLEAGLPLRAVLWRMQIPAGAVRRLAPGVELALPAAALSRVRLEERGGAMVAGGRLGQAHGERAVRLEAAGPPDMPRQLRPDLAGDAASASAPVPATPATHGGEEG